MFKLSWRPFSGAYANSAYSCQALNCLLTECSIKMKNTTQQPLNRNGLTQVLSGKFHSAYISLYGIHCIVSASFDGSDESARCAGSSEYSMLGLCNGSNSRKWYGIRQILVNGM